MFYFDTTNIHFKINFTKFKIIFFILIFCITFVELKFKTVMNISIEKYNIHCKLFNAMTIKELQDLYNDDDFMYDVNNEFNNMHHSLLLYLPQRLFNELEKLTNK